MQHERHFSGNHHARARIRCHLVPLVALIAVAFTATAEAQQMKDLPPPVVDELRDKEGITDILINRVVEKGSPVKINGFTTAARRGNSAQKELGANETLNFQVSGQDDPSSREIVITVTIDKSVLAGNPNDRIQTDNMSIGFVRGTNTCWQECWKEGGKKICDQVCF